MYVKPRLLLNKRVMKFPDDCPSDVSGSKEVNDVGVLSQTDMATTR